MIVLAASNSIDIGSSLFVCVCIHIEIALLMPLVFITARTIFLGLL